MSKGNVIEEEIVDVERSAIRTCCNDWSTGCTLCCDTFFLECGSCGKSCCSKMADCYKCNNYENWTNLCERFGDLLLVTIVSVLAINIIVLFIISCINVNKWGHFHTHETCTVTDQISSNCNNHLDCTMKELNKNGPNQFNNTCVLSYHGVYTRATYYSCEQPMLDWLIYTGVGGIWLTGSIFAMSFVEENIVISLILFYNIITLSLGIWGYILFYGEHSLNFKECNQERFEIIKNQVTVYFWAGITFFFTFLSSSIITSICNYNYS